VTEHLELVKRAKSGDEEAFIRLMESQSDCMYKMAKTILKNEEDVANGDVGEVLNIYKADGKSRMRVDFGDGRVMEYQEEDYWPLTLAYAITVHKAQGSEYPMAILPMLPCFRWMLRRNIFYTAVTRARERFIIVGSKRAIAQAIRTDYISRRNTMFGYRIRKIYEAILEQEKSA
jgi:exodeoxyribonuclease V alpha subunit